MVDLLIIGSSMLLSGVAVKLAKLIFPFAVRRFFPVKTQHSTQTSPDDEFNQSSHLASQDRKFILLISGTESVNIDNGIKIIIGEIQRINHYHFS